MNKAFKIFTGKHQIYFQNVPLDMIRDVFHKTGSHSCDDALYFMTFLKLRILSRNYGGNLPCKKDISNYLGMSVETVKKHLQVLHKNNWVRLLDNGKYQLVSIARLYREQSNSPRYDAISLDNSELEKYSYKNLRKFRALLCSILEDKALRHNKFIEKEKFFRKERKKPRVQKSKEFRLKLKISSSSKSGENYLYDNLSLGLSSYIVNKSKGTVSKYHKTQRKPNPKKLNKDGTLSKKQPLVLQTYKTTRRVEEFKFLRKEDIPVLNNNIEYFTGEKYGKFIFRRGKVTFVPLTKKLINVHIIRRVRFYTFKNNDINQSYIIDYENNVSSFGQIDLLANKFLL